MILNKLLFISSFKHTLFIALFFILSSCSSYYNYESDFIGLYIRNYHSYGIGASMELKKNKVFEYHWQKGLLSGVTKGTWKKSGRHIVFNSEKMVQNNQEFHSSKRTHCITYCWWNNKKIISSGSL